MVTVFEPQPKPDNWVEFFATLGIYEKACFDIQHKASIRTTLSVAVKDKFPSRIYQTDTDATTITIERLK